ncbi:MAG: 50S ribosomal protein L23 [bacterium]|nr:50S ribosomal protein L23 [bacterium]
MRTGGGDSSRILVTPWVSEKAAQQADAGTYVFKVAMSANKIEIQKAVESLWDVKVDSVRTIRGKGKVFGARTRHGKRADWKKALVTLKKGQLIDLYEGV